MKKWPITLSTTEPHNYIGLVHVRQGNRNSEVLRATLTENGVPINLLKCKAYLEAILGKHAVERACTIVDAENGIVEFVFDEYTLQQPGSITANIKIVKDDGTINTTQDFKYFVIRAVSMTEIETGSYWQSVQDLLNDLEAWMINSKEDYEQWFESIREILESIDPGGMLLKEIMDARKDMNGAVHGSITDRLRADMMFIKAELEKLIKEMREQHYTLKAFEVNTLEILQDDSFSINHEIEIVGSVDYEIEDGALVIATVDDEKQGVFTLEKVGEV